MTLPHEMDGSHANFTAFNRKDGTATEAAIELATISDRPIEEIFKDEAESLAALGLRLPLHESVPLSHAANVSQTDGREVVELNERNRLIRHNLNLLPRHVSYILCLRNGISVDRVYTLEEIAKDLGVTKEWIREIEKKALRRLRYMEATGRLLDYKPSQSKVAHAVEQRPHPLGNVQPADRRYRPLGSKPN
jgi:hypothetical protein